MEQLDEHLNGRPPYCPPSFMQIGLAFFIYFIILIVSFVLYYAIFESSGLLIFLDKDQSNFGILTKHIVLFLVLESIFALSNYYLQGRLYDMLGQSVPKAALIPTLLWGTIFGIAFLYDSYKGIPFPNYLIIFMRISSLLIWYSTLSLIIAFYFKHKSRVKYYSALFLHWVLTTAIFYTLIHLL